MAPVFRLPSATMHGTAAMNPISRSGKKEEREANKLQLVVVSGLALSLLLVCAVGKSSPFFFFFSLRACAVVCLSL